MSKFNQCKRILTGNLNLMDSNNLGQTGSNKLSLSSLYNGFEGHSAALRDGDGVLFYAM